METSIIWFLRT